MAKLEMKPILQDGEYIMQYNYNGDKTAESSDESHIRFPSCRIVLYVMLLLGLACSYMLRATLPVAILAMVNNTFVEDSAIVVNTSELETAGLCPRQYNYTPPQGGKFNWNRVQQSVVLASFYFGHTLTQIPGGWLADRVGSKWLMICSVFATSAMTLLKPVAARINIVVLIILRVFTGLSDGVLMPAVHSILARWTPPSQYSIASGIVYSGADIGAAVGILFTGFLSQSSAGWPSAFYLLGAVACLWSILSVLLIYSSPSVHPRISNAERSYLESQISVDGCKSTANLPTPWRQLFTSLPGWAVAFSHFADSWAFVTLFTGLPMFMDNVLGVNIAQNGILSSIPFFISPLVIFGTGALADWVRSTGRFSTTVVRKVSAVIGLIFPAVFLVIASFAGCNSAVVTVLMFLAMGCAGVGIAFVFANILDIAGPHSGKLMGLANTVDSLAMIFAPLAIGALTTGNVLEARSQWQNVFFICGGIYVGGTVFYLVFGSGERQSWAVTVNTETAQNNDVDSKVKQEEE